MHPRQIHTPQMWLGLFSTPRVQVNWSSRIIKTYNWSYHTLRKEACMLFRCRNGRGCIGLRVQMRIQWLGLLIITGLSFSWHYMEASFTHKDTRADWPEELGFVWHASKDPTHGLPSSWQQDERISISSCSSPLPHSRYTSCQPQPACLLPSSRNKEGCPALLAVEISRSSDVLDRGERGAPLFCSSSPLFRSSMEFRVCAMCVPRSDRRSRASSGLGLFALYSLLFAFFLSTKRCSWEGRLLFCMTKASNAWKNLWFR
jgi:hypothetical protein